MQIFKALFFPDTIIFCQLSAKKAYRFSTKANPNAQLQGRMIRSFTEN